MVSDVVKRASWIREVMDLGCGKGDSIEFFRKLLPEVRWVGLDIEGSPEVLQRTRKDVDFATFDGVHIPFEADRFDLIFCRQVLEHVRQPKGLLAEVRRVLRPGGYFAGSTSHLEPYHSYSCWNYTPFGFSELVRECGLTVEQVRPGLDALTLILRKLANTRLLDRYWRRESPSNRILSLVGRLTKKPHDVVNRKKLLFCGQFSFIVRKPSPPR